MKINHIGNLARYWNNKADAYCQEHQEHLDASLHPSWGLWNLHENELRIILDDLKPETKLLDVGCGRGQDAVGFAEYGAEVVAVDLSAEQLRHAIHHPRVQYLCSSAEMMPLQANSIEIAISDHGAFDHSYPPDLLREIWRILQPGGILALCTYSPLAFSCFASNTGRLSANLQRPYPSNRISFDGQVTAVEYSYAEWIKCFRTAGYEIERLEELRAPAEAQMYFDQLVDIDWGARWPCDIIWRVRKTHA